MSKLDDVLTQFDAVSFLVGNARNHAKTNLGYALKLGLKGKKLTPAQVDEFFDDLELALRDSAQRALRDELPL